jgi:hypothetical protein
MIAAALVDKNLVTKSGNQYSAAAVSRMLLRERESLEGIGSLAPRRRPTSSFGEFNPPAVKPFVVKLAV